MAKKDQQMTFLAIPHKDAAGADTDEFRKEMAGIPWMPDKRQRNVRRLARAYHNMAEAYDRTVCRHRIDGTAMPSNGQEFALVSRNAAQLMRRAFAIAQTLYEHRGEAAAALTAAIAEESMEGRLKYRERRDQNT